MTTHLNGVTASIPDTGWRDISALVTPPPTWTIKQLYIRAQGLSLWLHINITGTGSGTRLPLALPDGWKVAYVSAAMPVGMRTGGNVWTRLDGGVLIEPENTTGAMALIQLPLQRHPDALYGTPVP